ncbi:hypothetical protein [Streptomyces sp. ID38640]|uniref:hypothetical protein n=1 Tax=Streptomyces sp. ID38640 TaxID=1265399 RepID=UPI002180A658|nr:hypothetical protein [Streptomyces sp. ID38640]
MSAVLRNLDELLGIGAEPGEATYFGSAEGHGLPGPYEPLLLMYERGGGCFLEEYLDLNGVMIRLGNVESTASVTPFLMLAPATLDALDAEGQISYYAKVSAGSPGAARAESSGVVSAKTRHMTKPSPGISAGSRPSTSSCTTSATTTSTMSRSQRLRLPRSSNR